MIQVLMELLGRLSNIPGLGFLLTYQQQLQTKLGRMGQKISDYKQTRDNAMAGVKSVRDLPKNVKGAKKRG